MIVLFCSFRLNLSAVYTDLVGLLSVMPSKAGSFPLKLYFYEEFLILKGAIASLGNCVP